jgi:excisionase family DNA binding protein
MNQPVPKKADELELFSFGLDRVKDVARFLNISKALVYTYIKRGELKSIKFGKARRIPRLAVLEFVAKHLQPHNVSPVTCLQEGQQ